MHACCRGTEAASVKQILKNVCKNVQCSFESSVQAKSCTTDPEAVRSGDVFFALPNKDTDLEESVGLAIHRKCCAVVADRPVAGAETVPFYIIPNVFDGYAAFCHAVFDSPARSLKMVGITGTSGKTTTSYLISGMLAENGCQVGLISSLGVFDGETFYTPNIRDWTPEHLAAELAKMTGNGCTHAVIEVSSKMLTEGMLSGIQFDAVCLTNIRRDHIDYHQSVEQYRRSKLGIFKYAKKKALAVCNADDRITEAVVPLINHPLLTVGIRNAAEISASLIERFPNEQTFFVNAGTEAVPLCTKIIGDEHIYNCLTAVALGIGFGLNLRTIARGIERVESVPGRMERLTCGQEFNVFLDSARTADSLSAVLKTVRDITPGRLVCVFGAAAEHDSEKRPQFGKIMESAADTVILTSADDALDTGTAAAICDIGRGFASGNGVQVMPDRAEAIAAALSEAQEGDSVLIFGKGETEQLENIRGSVSFCDRHFTRQWLYENQPCPV
ncbi:MAG: UDP-N-acetylmuramyl-tripeptide synthetase [Planctomycetaceae bacterium]|jgi:UDP-N-acetylmuramoyl-L-alanyl-D-glutamate--2,6-diaminopimelate ligase|nr:UDP-N-acetylmuramyl-tripeptide synthetase [Planctomycetaceae bacterium]